MEYVVKYEINVDDYMSIRDSVGFNGLYKEQCGKAIKNSMINVSVFDGDICVGVGRIVGDNILKGMLTDIMVRSDYQKKGIGKIIVTSLINKLTNQVGDGESFQLEASPTFNNRDFYVKCGLKYKPENQDGVYLWIRK